MMIAHTAAKLTPLDSHLGSNPRSTFIDFDEALLEGPHPMTTDLKRMIGTCRALPDHVGDLAKSRKFQPIQYWSHLTGREDSTTGWRSSSTPDSSTYNFIREAT